jgi:hypothetical protein
VSPEWTGRRILGLPLNLECFGESPDFGMNVETVRDYMVLTLLTYYDQGYRFDGKYAFEGHWERPILWALADADAIEGVWNFDDGERFSFEEYAPKELEAMVVKAILALRNA